LINLGNARDSQGRYREAISLWQQALAIYRETGDPFGTALALTCEYANGGGGWAGRIAGRAGKVQLPVAWYMIAASGVR
jgi:tetratricopeptide (TPR) repeat protein